MTRVPGFSRVMRSPSSPRVARVVRSAPDVGAADSESGWPRDHPEPVRNRHTKNWPAATVIVASRGPVTYTDTTPGDSVTTWLTFRRWCQDVSSGAATRKTRTHPSATEYSPHQYVVAIGEEMKSAPVHSWWGRARPAPR